MGDLLKKAECPKLEDRLPMFLFWRNGPNHWRHSFGQCWTKIHPEEFLCLKFLKINGLTRDLQQNLHYKKVNTFNSIQPIKSSVTVSMFKCLLFNSLCSKTLKWVFIMMPNRVLTVAILSPSVKRRPCPWKPKFNSKFWKSGKGSSISVFYLQAQLLIFSENKLSIYKTC